MTLLSTTNTGVDGKNLKNCTDEKIDDDRQAFFGHFEKNSSRKKTQANFRKTQANHSKPQ